MSHNSYFQFKQFRIEQHYAAMKVNTDGVLLGGWTCLDGVDTVLDIGTGTGLIALMIAQRSRASVTALEIDEHTALEAAGNVKNSPWPERISVQHISFQRFAESCNEQYELIVSNPPFFSNGVKNTNPRLSIARHNHSLPFTDILAGTHRLLKSEGRLALILPVEESEEFIKQAAEDGFFLNRISRVNPFPGKEPNRCLMEFSKNKGIPVIDSFSVYDEEKKNYSEKFAKLAGSFYLKL